MQAHGELPGTAIEPGGCECDLQELQNLEKKVLAFLEEVGFLNLSKKLDFIRSFEARRQISAYFLQHMGLPRLES